MTAQDITDEHHRDAQTLWDYHQLGHEPQNTEVAVVLGSYDLGAARHAAALYHQGRFPLIVFTGATNDYTIDVFPQGEAVAFHAAATAAGVPDTATMIEDKATNSGANITLSRQLLLQAGIVPKSVMLIAMPFMERRAFATCRAQWPEVDVVCSSQPISLADYLVSSADPRHVLCDMVGDLQRIIEYPKHGYMIEQVVPEEVHAALKRLIVAGYDSVLPKP
ncbi:YdcF family protein [Catenulispora yoronensis]|uniref:YdcF family protein n=1 Tax=Catenulispora yoronensis TaxID=450799 RepID=A0ABP5F9M1_9ACTN